MSRCAPPPEHPPDHTTITTTQPNHHHHKNIEKMTLPPPTLTNVLIDMARDSADALIATTVALITSMTLLSDIMEPLVGLHALSLDLASRRCARIYLLSAKSDLMHAELIREMKTGIDSGVLTRWQKLRLEELVGELAGVEEILKEVQEELTVVMGTYNVGEE